MVVRNVVVFAFALIVGLGVFYSCVRGADNGSTPEPVIVTVGPEQPTGPPESMAPPAAAWGAAPEAEVPPASAVGTGEWLSSGICSPAPVTPELVRLVFDPGTVAVPEAGQAGLDVEVRADGVRFGDYVVTLDPVNQKIRVDGPDGAEGLERDLMRCVSADHQGSDGNVGIWRWSGEEGAWRYVDEPIVPMTMPAPPGTNA